MAEIFKVVLSLLFQAAAAVIALRLLKVARRHPAVLFIVVTGLLMLLRHAVVLFYILSGYSLTPFEQMHETLCLVVSAGLFGMVAYALLLPLLIIIMGLMVLILVAITQKLNGMSTPSP